MPTSKDYYYAEKISGAIYDLYDGCSFGGGFRQAYRIMKRTDTYDEVGITRGVPTVFASTIEGGSLSYLVVQGNLSSVNWTYGSVTVSVPYTSHHVSYIKDFDSYVYSHSYGSRTIGDSLSSDVIDYSGVYVFDDGTELTLTNHLNITYNASQANTITTVYFTLSSTYNNVVLSYAMKNLMVSAGANPTKTSYIWSSKTTDFDFTGLTLIFAYYQNGLLSSQDYITSSQLTITHDQVDKTQKINAFPFTATYHNIYTNEAVTYSFTSQNSPISCEPLTCTFGVSSPSDSLDHNDYYDNGTSPFAFPKDSSGALFTFKLSYNDSQFDKTINADNSNIAYSISGQSGNLSVGDTLTSLSGNTSGTSQIGVSFTLPSDYEQVSSVGSTNYTISVIHDEVSSIALKNAWSIIRGNKLSELSKPSLTQIFKSGKSVDGYKDYTWASGQDDIINGPGKAISALSIVDNTTGSTFAVDIQTAPTISNPTPSSIVLNKQVTTTYNVLDKISLGELTATISYSDASYKATTNSIQYVDSVPSSYSDGVLYVDSIQNTSSNPDYLALEELNGSVGIYKSHINTAVSQYNPKVYFKAKDPFGASIEETQLQFKVIGITKIDGLYINNIYDSYKVGDYFLNDNDTTEATVYYTDVNGDSRSYSGFLNNMMGSLNIYPAKGTLLKTQTDSRKVTITSSYDASVTYSYDISVSSKYDYSSTTSTLKLKPVIISSDRVYKFLSNDGTEYLSHAFKAGDIALISNDDYNASNIVNKTTLRMVNEDSLATGEDDTRNNIVLIYGYVNNVYVASEVSDSDYYENSLFQGIVALFHDYKPEIDGDSNITALFPCKTFELIGDTKDSLTRYSVSDYINQCTIGICFGHNNNANRLWASGNSTKPNFDWHSTEPNSTNDDSEASYSGGYGYFSEESKSKYGETDNKIVGYDIISDSKLVVYKNHSNKEPSIYFRVPKLATAYDSLGNVMKDIDGNTMYQEEYTLSVSNSPISAISNKSHVNFNGDALFVDDDNEVAGLDVEGIIGDSQRQGNTRSYYIDKALKECDMGESLMFVSGRTLYLYAPKYGIFVSDRDSKSNSQYEWWLLDDREPTCFFDHSKYVYFGDSNGYIYKIDPTTYKDNQRVFVDDSELLTIYAEDKPSTTNFNEDNRVLVTNQDIISLLNSSSDGRYFRPVTKSSSSNDDNAYMFARIGEANTTYSSNADLFIDQTNNVIACKNAKIAKKIGSLNDYYLNYSASQTKIVTSDTASFALYKKYKLVPSDKTIASYDNYALYAMQDSDGNALDLSKLTMADLCVKLNGEYLISDVTAYSDGVGGYFSILDDDGNAIDITRYGSQSISMNFNGEITKYTPVTSKLITAPLMADSSNWFKTVWKIAVTNGANLDSDLDIAYVSNKVSSEDHKTINSVSSSVAVVSRAVSGFSFEGADFMAMDFSKSLVPRSVVINRQIGHCKSLTMMMRSDNAAASIIPTLSITYTVPHPSEGSN